MKYRSTALNVYHVSYHTLSGNIRSDTLCTNCLIDVRKLAKNGVFFWSKTAKLGSICTRCGKVQSNDKETHRGNRRQANG